MEHVVHLADRPALRVVSKRVSVGIESIGPTLAQAFGEVYAMIGAADVGTAGPPFVIYHSMPEPGQPLDMEICAPVDGTLEPRDPWRLVDLPAGMFASRKHVGPYDTVGETYDALTAWIPEHGYTVAGPPREVYLSEPSTPPELTETIIEFPVAKVPMPVG
jgi:effector-binding domain-containing protein